MLFTALLFAVLLFPEMIIAESSTLKNLNANNDHGFWLENNLDTKIAKEWNLRFHNELRWGSHYRKFWYQEYLFVFQNDLKNYFNLSSKSAISKISLGPGFNATYQLHKNERGHFRWVLILKPLIEAQFDVTYCDWQFRQRIRGEFLFYCRGQYENHNIYRHRLVIQTPYKWTSWKINPFISNEWFFRKNTWHHSSGSGLVGGYYQNRLRFGVDLAPFHEKVNHTLYWQWRAEKQAPGSHPSWSSTYVVGLGTTI